jgi:hypothetical protein
VKRGEAFGVWAQLAGVLMDSHPAFLRASKAEQNRRLRRVLRFLYKECRASEKKKRPRSEEAAAKTMTEIVSSPRRELPLASLSELTRSEPL